MRARWRWVLGGAALVLALAVVAWTALRWVRRHAKGPPIIDASEPRIGSALPAFDGATAWLNSKPLVAARLGGRVTALQSWSGADLASDRVVPVALEWARRYAPAGLRVLFVHVPRFAFAQESSFVANDARRLGIDGPVLVDGEQSVWGRYGVLPLPALVIADHRGIVRYARGGPRGQYAAEQALRGLLAGASAGRTLPLPVLRSSDDEPGGFGDATPPVALVAGSGATGALQSVAPGQAHFFAPALRAQVESADGVPAPVGEWFVGGEGLRSTRGTAADYLALRYHGRDVYAVISTAAGEPARVWVLRDERWLSPGEAGPDVHADERGASVLAVSEPRMYHVVRAADAGSHVLKLQPDRPGVEIYEFYFDASRP
jgi:hypothetical protein